MKKHLNESLIFEYNYSPDKKTKKLVESHINECEICKKKVRFSQKILNNPELEKQASKVISDEDVQKIIKKLEPTHSWEVNEDSMINKFILHLIAIYNLIIDRIILLFEFVFPSPPQLAYATRSTRRYDNAPIKRFKLGFLNLRNQINCKKNFEKIKVEIQFNKIRGKMINMSVQLDDPEEKKVRISLIGSNIGNLSETIDKKCEFNNLPFDTYCMIVRQYANFKGKLIFSVKKAGIYEQKSF